VDIAFTHGSRWYVADWKSNHLGDSPASYDEGTILREMSANHYILQYHLYLLALHRYLAVRQPGYDYDSHIGGAWYAFVRGIDGSPGRGWWHDRPPRALIEALDAALVAPAMRAEAAG
jgi:exodeoxyribonuclease V beta subunit